jgi:biopolymer transport protein ExbB
MTAWIRTILLSLALLGPAALAADQAPATTPVVAPVAAAQPAPGAAVPAAPPAQLHGFGEQLIKRFEDGGMTMWGLLLLSVLGITFCLERLWNQRGGAIAPAGFLVAVEAKVKAGDWDAVRALAAANRSIAGRIVAALAREPGASKAELDTLAGEIAGRQMRSHHQRIYPLAIVSTLAPLMGLLGTVSGIIKSFDVIAVTGTLGDATLLAGGISEALIATAFGLLIAIPALGLYHVFKIRLNLAGTVLEERISNLIAVWTAKKAA